MDDEQQTQTSAVEESESEARERVREVLGVTLERVVHSWQAHRVDCFALAHSWAGQGNQPTPTHTAHCTQQRSSHKPTQSAECHTSHSHGHRGEKKLVRGAR